MINTSRPPLRNLDNHVTVAIVHESSVYTYDEMAAIVQALALQDSRDVAPEWNLAAASVVLATPATVPHGAWELRCTDDSDQPGALGYHTGSGAPRGYAFLKTAKDAGYSPIITISHELIEMRVDPTTRRTRATPDGRYAIEACDPCEADNYGYVVGNYTLSDFVWPNWFASTRPHAIPLGAKFDHAGYVHAPHQLLPGGYCLVETPGQGWHQVTARETPEITKRPGTSGRTSQRLSEVA